MRANNRSRFRRGVACLCVAALLALLGAALVGCAPSAPATLLIDLSEEESIHVSWEARKGASSYVLQVRFGEGEPEEIATEATEYRVPRRAGAISVRVAARKGEKQGAFGDWVTTQVAALTLPQPAAYRVLRVAPQDEAVYYRLAVRSGEWQRVTVPHEGEPYAPEFYQVVTQAPGQEEGVAKLTPQTFAYADLVNHRFYFDRAGEWSVYLRALPYMAIGGQVIGEPDWLYARYAAEVGKEGWRKATVRVEG